MVERCAPSKNYSDGSCYTLEQLLKIARAYRRAYPDKEFPIKANKAYLVKKLEANPMLGKCHRCWLSLKFVRDLKDEDMLLNTFRPDGPANSLDWLNTKQINQVVRQYTAIYPDFVFLGAVPMDFDDLPSLKIADLDFDELIRDGVTKMGIVFNLDEHHKPGSHWVAMFANLDEGHIYYFDSYGHKPDERVVALIGRIEKFLRNQRKMPIVKLNKTRHQYKYSECGVYSINFILRCLKNESFDDISKKTTGDDKMSKCRKVYFNST